MMKGRNEQFNKQQLFLLEIWTEKKEELKILKILRRHLKKDPKSSKKGEELRVEKFSNLTSFFQKKPSQNNWSQKLIRIQQKVFSFLHLWGRQAALYPN